MKAIICGGVLDADSQRRLEQLLVEPPPTNHRILVLEALPKEDS